MNKTLVQLKDILADMFFVTYRNVFICIIKEDAETVSYSSETDFFDSHIYNDCIVESIGVFNLSEYTSIDIFVK